MTINVGLMTSASDRWFTPPDLLGEVEAFLGDCYFDPCPATPAGVPPVDGLACTWARQRVYCNPPYGRGIGAWVEKASGEGVREIVLLVPARTDTSWFRALWRWDALCFIRGRLRFSGAASGAPFQSVLAYRGPRGGEFGEAFKHRGAVVWDVWEGSIR